MVFDDLFAPPVAVGHMRPATAQADALLPCELDCVRGAVVERRREFAAGRQLARRLMGGFGINAGPLLPGADRAPRWPAGVVGTITHTRRFVLVAVARSEDVLSLGCDIEDDQELPREIVPMILAPAEQARLQDSGPSVTNEARLIFSAKEAVYKAQYPLTRCFLDFHDLLLEIDAVGQRFAATLQRDAGRFAAGTRFDGVFRRRQGSIATAVVLHHP